MKLYPGFKQFLDYLFSILLLLLLSPVFIIIAVVIKLDSKGPVLFKQKRIGKDIIEFNIYKFRTMRSDTPGDMPTHLFQNAESFITRPGKLLRRSSLDELPQLFNIIAGQMSFIGPRPALWNQYDLIEAREQQLRKYGVNVNSIKPGITGWAQVNGRDELPIEVKADLDGYYTKNISFLLDLKIFLMTIINTLTARGIKEGSEASDTKEKRS